MLKGFPWLKEDSSDFSGMGEGMAAPKEGATLTSSLESLKFHISLKSGHKDSNNPQKNPKEPPEKKKEKKKNQQSQSSWRWFCFPNTQGKEGKKKKKKGVHDIPGLPHKGRPRCKRGARKFYPFSLLPISSFQRRQWKSFLAQTPQERKSWSRVWDNTWGNLFYIPKSFKTQPRCGTWARNYSWAVILVSPINNCVFLLL